MSIGIQAAKIRLLDTRQSFRLEAEHHLAPGEWSEPATYRFCLPQTEPADHLIASAPYVSLCAARTESQDFSNPRKAVSSIRLSHYDSLLFRKLQLAMNASRKRGCAKRNTRPLGVWSATRRLNRSRWNQPC